MPRSGRLLWPSKGRRMASSAIARASTASLPKRFHANPAHRGGVIQSGIAVGAHRTRAAGGDSYDPSTRANKSHSSRGGDRLPGGGDHCDFRARCRKDRLSVIPCPRLPRPRADRRRDHARERPRTPWSAAHRRQVCLHQGLCPVGVSFHDGGDDRRMLFAYHRQRADRGRRSAPISRVVSRSSLTMAADRRFPATTRISSCSCRSSDQNRASSAMAPRRDDINPFNEAATSGVGSDATRAAAEGFSHDPWSGRGLAVLVRRVGT